MRNLALSASSLLLLNAFPQILVDSIPLPGINQGFWGIHADPDTIFLGADFSGSIYFLDHQGTILGQRSTGLNFNHGLVRRPSSFLIAQDYTTSGAQLFEVGDDGTLLNSWTFPPVIGGNSSGIGDICADGDAIWYTMYHPDFDSYPFAYAYRWVPGTPTPSDTVPLHGEQPYGIALKGDTLLYVTDNLNGDQERIYAYDLTNEQDMGWVDLPDTPIDNDQRPQGMHYDGEFLYLVANRQGGSAFAYQTIFKYAFDLTTAVFVSDTRPFLAIHPSPATDVVELFLSENASRPFRVCDASGRAQAVGSFIGGRSAIRVSDWPPGLYTIHAGDLCRRFLVAR